MFGFGLPEILGLLLIGFYIFCILMTVDAVLRPPNRFIVGRKPMWIGLLILTNPLITKFAGGIFWFLGTLIFAIGSVVYYGFNRMDNPMKPKPDDIETENNENA